MDLKVKIKKLKENAVVPMYAKQGDAGLDLTVVEITNEMSEDGVPMLVYHSGLSIEIPEGYVGLLFPRSSISKTSLTLTNSVGVIDSGYRGEIMAKFKINTNTLAAVYPVGDRFAQLIIMPYPIIEFEVSEELTETERGEGGYGSTNTNREDDVQLDSETKVDEKDIIGKVEEVSVDDIPESTDIKESVTIVNDEQAA